MSDVPGEKRPWFKRERYIIDRELQFSLARPLVAILLLTGGAYVAAIFLIPGQAALEAMSAEQTRSLFRRATLIYYLLGTGLIGLAALLITHRIAGPVWVMERAVRGMLKGDFQQRLSLRPTDYLQGFAQALTELRGQLAEREERKRELLRELESCLERGDVVAARKLLVDLGLPADDDAPPASGPTA